MKKYTKLFLCYVFILLLLLTFFPRSSQSWLIVDAQKREYVGISDVGGDLLSAYWLQFPAGSVSITNEVATVYYAGAYQQNLLTNTQWIFCSNSDTAKGIGSMTFDAGAVAAPTAGLTATGSTSGATGKIMTVTLSTGAWDSNDATGTMTLGSCSGRWHDNEEIHYTGGRANVNKPNSAAGVDLIQNGEFSVDTDPPPGWTAVTATLTTDAGGQVTNMMTVASSGAALGKAYQDITTVVGKIYYFDGYFKKGTSDSGKIMIGITTDEDSIWDSGALTDAAWARKTRYFVATATTTRITCQTTDATITETSLFDEINVYEVTPGCTAASSLAFDGWNKSITAHLYRVHNDGGTLTKDGSFYSLLFVPTAAGDYINFPGSGSSNVEWYQQYAGRPVCVGVWLLTSTASHARARIYDGVTETYSSYHTGGGVYEWIEKTATISASPTLFNVRIYGSSASLGSIYISQPMLVFGSSIGQGNYMLEADRKIYFENSILSQSFHNKTGANGFSDIPITELNLEADSGCCVGKGVKAIRVFTTCKDSGSAGTDCYLKAGYDISAIGNEFNNSPYGLTNDCISRRGGWISCNSTGNYEYQIEATGSSTFDINSFAYIGGEWR